MFAIEENFYLNNSFELNGSLTLENMDNNASNMFTMDNNASKVKNFEESKIIDACAYSFLIISFCSCCGLVYYLNFIAPKMIAAPIYPISIV